MKKNGLNQDKLLRWLNFHEKNVIYEIIFTTMIEKTPNAAAMGVKISNESMMIIRPFTTTQTCKALNQTRKGVINIVTDVRAYVTTALKCEIPGFRLEFEEWEDDPILKCADLWVKCKANIITTDPERPTFLLQPISLRINEEQLKKTWSRGDYAVLEAIILATRTDRYYKSGTTSDLYAKLTNLSQIIERISPNGDSYYKICFTEIFNHVEEILSEQEI